MDRQIASEFSGTAKPCEQRCATSRDLDSGHAADSNCGRGGERHDIGWVQTAIAGGSFLNTLKGDLIQDGAAAGAFAIGGAKADNTFTKAFGADGVEAAYLAAHAALGCAAGVASGTGCAGGAIGGVTSAVIAGYLVDQAGGAANLTVQERAAITAAAMLSGATVAGLSGQNVSAAASAAANEALNKSEAVHPGAAKPQADIVSRVCGPYRSLSIPKIQNRWCPGQHTRNIQHSKVITATRKTVGREGRVAIE